MGLTLIQEAVAYAGLMKPRAGSRFVRTPLPAVLWRKLGLDVESPAVAPQAKHPPRKGTPRKKKGKSTVSNGRARTQFKPGGKGGPGRPKGSVSIAKFADLKAALTSIFESQDYYDMVRAKAIKGRLPGPVWRFYLEHLHGKAPQKLEHDAGQSLYDLLARIDPDTDDDRA